MGLFSFFSKIFGKPGLPDSIDFIFFGLGNPGSRYAQTRHNIGFRVVDGLAERLSEKKQGSFEKADWVYGKIDSRNVLIVKPLTFMNRSGIAVKDLINQSKVNLTTTMVVVDDFNIPLGTLRARRGGSHGGHNGLKSITSAIGPDFPRLRFGIGPLPEGADIIDFVLGDFSDQEEITLADEIPRAVEALNFFIKEGIDPLMNKYNK